MCKATIFFHLQEERDKVWNLTNIMEEFLISTCKLALVIYIETSDLIPHAIIPRTQESNGRRVKLGLFGSCL